MVSVTLDGRLQVLRMIHRGVKNALNSHHVRENHNHGAHVHGEDLCDDLMALTH